MKKYNDTIGTRTLDLPACSAVPQPTASLRREGAGSWRFCREKEGERNGEKELSQLKNLILYLFPLTSRERL
jgi:hypothetical protein